jgi:hypothetical protein
VYQPRVENAERSRAGKGGKAVGQQLRGERMSTLSQRLRHKEEFPAAALQIYIPGGVTFGRGPACAR